MALTLCEALIAADIQESCTAPMVKGYEKVGYIFNKQDVDTFTRTGNVVSDISLLSGMKAYYLYNAGNTPFNGSTTTLNVADIRNTFDKTAQFLVLNDGPKTSEEIIDGLANGSFVVVLEQSFTNDQNGNNKFEIIGLECGAKATAIEKDRNSEDTRGAYLVTLTESQAPTSALFFFKTDIATSRTHLDGLC